MSQPAKVLEGADTALVESATTGLRRGRPRTLPPGQKTSQAARDRYAKKLKLKRVRDLFEEMERTPLLPRLAQPMHENVMRPFFAERYPGFSEFYAEEREDSGWSQARSPEEQMPGDDGLSRSAVKLGPKADGGLRNHPWRGYR